MKVCEVLDCFKCLFQSPVYSKLSVEWMMIKWSSNKSEQKILQFQNSIYYAVAAVSQAILENDILIFWSLHRCDSITNIIQSMC